MDEEKKATPSEVSDELRLLGKRLREAFDAARESRQAQEFREELNRGLGELREEIDEVSKSEEVQRFQESARAAVQDVGKGDVGQQIRRGLLTALKEINVRLERVVQEAETGTPAEDTPPEEPSA
jgi:hypothetical protein